MEEEKANEREKEKENQTKRKSINQSIRIRLDSALDLSSLSSSLSILRGTISTLIYFSIMLKNNIKLVLVEIEIIQ